ncbi:MAG: DUF2141 domain-containing protein [Rhodospirillaceae bacterium]|nr:DUF2141 domain-containing protein [Rhodospirillaceae bacterium]
MRHRPPMLGRRIIYAFFLILAAGTASAADLAITITGIRSADGLVRLAIFDKPGEFPEGEEYAAKDVAARVVAQTVIFRNIEPGRYAVAMHHDENANHEMDFYFFGLPKEGYGFSRNAPVFFVAPGFEEAAFTVPARGLQISFEVRY